MEIIQRKTVPKRCRFLFNNCGVMGLLDKQYFFHFMQNDLVSLYQVFR